MDTVSKSNEEYASHALEALGSISRNSCCGQCQEAKRVAEEALFHYQGEAKEEV